MKRKKKMEKTRDDLFEKEINLQDVLDNYRQALENRTLYNTLKVLFTGHCGQPSLVRVRDTLIIEV